MENNGLRLEILKAIEKNSRLTSDDLAAMLGADKSEVEKELGSMEDEKVICGYPTLIDWDKVIIWLSVSIDLKRFRMCT